jgi:hypothetical protein
MRILPTNLTLREPKMIPHRNLSRDTSENGVSFRVEACRKRLRVVRGNQKGPTETVEPAGILVALNVETGTEVSPGPRVIETRAELMDEAGIT